MDMATTYLQTANSTNDFVIAVALIGAFLLILVVIASAVIYVALKAILAQIFTLPGGPRALDIKDIQHGDILLVQSAMLGKTVCVDNVIANPSMLGGGTIVSEDGMTIHVPMGHLILIQRDKSRVFVKSN